MIFLGKTPTNISVEMTPSMLMRHGLIAGATGTGKTVTLQTITEQLSRQGICVFTADVKGDLAGLSVEGASNTRIEERIKQLGIQWSPAGNPVILWDLDGKYGTPIRTTMTDMGPLLLSRLLDLSVVQSAVLHIAYTIADEYDWLLATIDDLMALLAWMDTHSRDLQSKYGNIADNTLGAIQRGLLMLRENGGARFFGEPAMDIGDFLLHTSDGRGMINILDARSLIADSRQYATFLLWLLSELFEELPESGDLAVPKIVFFFDEAHLLFRDIPQVLLEQVEKVVRLIRSRGVGIFFVTQNPGDIPDVIRSQLGNRIQHALRAFTPEDQKALEYSARTFRPNPDFDTAEKLTELGTGVALVSVLDARGLPTITQETIIAPPHSRIGTITDGERATIMETSPVAYKYRDTIDGYSASEAIQKLQEETIVTPEKTETAPSTGGGLAGFFSDIVFGTSRRQGVIEGMAKEALRSATRKAGKAILRGILGGIVK